jgi:hypothetical protein
MHHHDGVADAEVLQRLVEHFRLHRRRRGFEIFARAPAVSGPVDQDHAVGLCELVAKRQAHRPAIRTRAMDHHDGRPRGVTRAEFDDVQPCAFDIDHPAQRRISALQHDHAGLRDQHQNHQRRDAPG